MSKREFTELAKAIASIENESERKRITERIADICEYSNPRFDRESFLRAIENYRKEEKYAREEQR